MSFFEKLTDGLRLYEVILLILGAIMFIALIVIMIVYASQRRTLKPLFMFFAIPVLMIVWPSIQKIKIDGEGAEIEKQVAAVEQNPTEENKEELQKTIEKLQNRNVKDPEVVKRVIKGYYLLGNNQAATQTMETLPKYEKADAMIKDVKTSIAITSKLEQQLTAVNQNPADSAKIKELNRLTLEATQLSIKNEQTKADILVADKKIETYKRTNPQVKLRTQFSHQ